MTDEEWTQAHKNQCREHLRTKLAEAMGTFLSVTSFAHMGCLTVEEIQNEFIIAAAMVPTAAEALGVSIKEDSE